MTSPEDAPPPLVVVGASVRAVAASARRAGWSVHAADLFADADLGSAATAAVRVPTGPELPWPAGLEAAVAGFPVAPWIYTGALENHPDLVDRLARSRPLAGNAGDRLRAVRDPALVARAARAAGLGFPDTFTDAASLPPDGSFLVKPRAGAGGRGIARWRGGRPPAGDPIWQRFVPGRPWSAAFAMDRSAARLFSASRQLVGRGWCGARGFAWCGAVDVPVAALPASLRSRLDRLGEVLADRFGLVGLVGVDLVVDAGGEAHVIEVNPRPTASLELAERATGESVAATHLAACGVPSPVVAGATPPRRPPAWAKAVVFAERTTSFHEHLAETLANLAGGWVRDDAGWPPLADLPKPGDEVAAGGPALTVFAAAGDAAAALAALRARTATVRMALRRAAVSPPSASARRGCPPPGSTA
ncbi:MAG: ATP-grasp domain-containing protein [Planctomycetaceae bacterium]